MIKILKKILPNARTSGSEVNTPKICVLVPYNDNDGSMKIMVPALNKMGYLRKPCTKEEINALISRIPDLPVINQKDHRSTENEYKNLLKHGSLDDLVRIIKTTYLRNMDRINQNKKLIAKDQIYFEEAEKLLQV